MNESARSTVKFVAAEFDDADHLGEVYRGLNVRYLRSRAGPFHSQMQKAVIGNLSFHANHHVSSMVIEGENRSGQVAIGFQGRNSVPRRVVGELFTNTDVFLLGGNVEHLAQVMPGQSTYQIFVPARLLEQEMAAQLNRDPVEFSQRRYFLRFGQQRVGNLIDIVTESLRTAKDVNSSSPSMTSPDALQAMQKALVERVVNVLISGEDDFFRQSRSFSSIEWTLLQARTFLHENEASSISLGDICQGIGVSKRTLQTAFAEGLGISPMRYLKLRRLQTVHRRLQETDADKLTIACAARDAGFTDLNRFGKNYKEIFGYLPSETPRP